MKKSFLQFWFFPLVFLSSLVFPSIVIAQSATLESIVVSKSTVLANNSDVQTATVTLNAEDPSSLDRVSLLINYLDDSGNPNRGYVSWYKATGFKKESGYGSEYIDLKVTDCVADPQSGKLVLTFKWTSLVTYGEMANNDLAYYVVQNGGVLFGGWRNNDTNFNVHSMAATLGSISVSKSTVLANNADVQTATVTLNAEDPSSIDRVSLLINYLDDSGNPNRGYVSWYKATGFKKESGYGSEYIDLKVTDCVVETQTGKLILTFKWTTLGTYGEIANNDLAYYVLQYGQPLFGGWQNHDTNFNVHSMAATLGSITVAKPTVLANNADVQTAIVTLNAEDPSSIDRVSLLINYLDDSGNPNRGYVSWYKTTGFKKESGYGSEYIDLKVTDCIADPQAGKLVVTFKWTTLGTYGEMANNDLAYYVMQYGQPLFGGWQNQDTNFNVHSMAATLGAIVVDKTTVLANNSDVQTATVTLNAEDPSSIDRVSLLINYLDDSGNPNRGYVSWYKATGFKKESGYGSEYIDLKVTDCAVGTQAGKLVLTFKWTSLVTYGEIANNDLAYYVLQYGNPLFGGWQNNDTNFNVHSMAATLGSISVAKPTVLANNSDVQTATVTLNAEDPSSIDRVSLLINYLDDSGNPNRGYVSWYKATGFKKESGYGSEYIDLKVTDCLVETQTGKLILSFKWTTLGTYGEINNNDLAYYVLQYGQPLFGGWQNHDTNFNVRLGDTTPPQISNLMPVNGVFVNTQAPVISAQFTDDLSGINVSTAKIMLNETDITALATITATGFTYTPTGSNLLNDGDEFTITVDVKDKSGNAAVQARTVFGVDTLPPAKGYLGVASIIGRTITVYSAAQDSGISGIAQVSFSTAWNGSEWLNWTEPESFVFNGEKVLELPAEEGLKKIAVKFKDAAGNWSIPFDIEVLVDLTPPTGSFTINNNSEQTNNTNVTLALSAEDSGSGVGWMSFSADNTNWTDQESYVSTRVFDLPPGDGLKTVYVKFGDWNGNWSAVISKSIILYTGPVFLVKINNGDVYTNSRAVTLTIEGQGATQSSFSTDNSTWTAPEDFAATKAIELPEGDGTKTVYAKFKNAAGTWSAVVSDTIVLDTTPPQLNITTPLDNAVVNAQ